MEKASLAVALEEMDGWMDAWEAGRHGCNGTKPVRYDASRTSSRTKEAVLSSDADTFELDAAGAARGWEAMR